MPRSAALVPALALPFLAVVVPSRAAAQQAPPAASHFTVRHEHGQNVYASDDPIYVPGEVQRPYAFGVSGRSALGYTYVETPAHFLPEILAAVRRDPF